MQNHIRTESPAGEVKMVLKRCALCRQYFEGIFDGVYACPNCRVEMPGSSFSPELHVEIPTWQKKPA